MVNSLEGKRYGIIDIPYSYGDDKLISIMVYMLFVPISITEMEKSWRIKGSSYRFDKLNETDDIPLYNLDIKWFGEEDIESIKITRG